MNADLMRSKTTVGAAAALISLGIGIAATWLATEHRREKHNEQLQSERADVQLERAENSTILTALNSLNSSSESIAAVQAQHAELMKEIRDSNKAVQDIASRLVTIEEKVRAHDAAVTELRLQQTMLNTKVDTNYQALVVQLGSISTDVASISGFLKGRNEHDFKQ